MSWLCHCLSVCVTLVTLAAPGTLAAAAPEPLSRDAFAERVLQTGHAATSIDAQAQIARAERAAAGRWQNPALAWERGAAVSGRRANETQDELTLRLPVVLSGRLALEVEAAASAAASAELQARWARAVLRHDARKAFDAVVAARARVAVLADAAEAVESLGKVVAARAQAGEAAGYEGLRLEFEAALVADLHEAARLELSRAEAAAGALLGSANTNLPPFAGDLLEQTLGQPTPGRAPALERPDVQALAKSAEAARLAAKAAGRRQVPDPVLTAGMQLLDVAESDRGAGYVVGLEVSLPLFDTGARDAEVAHAQARAADAARQELSGRAESMRAQVRAALDAKRARLAAHRDAVFLRAERLRALAQVAWRAGEAELLTLVDAHRAARDAHLAALDLALDVRNTETEDLLLTGSEP